MTTVVAGMPELSRARVMGVVNVTPDSFSDGGCHATAAAAIAHGAALLAAGADIVDVGGESTRPGAVRVSPAEELDRVLPVIEALAAAGATISVDTSRAVVARAALDAGASIVNDVSGGRADPDLPYLVADRGCPMVVMHSRGDSSDMATRTDYGHDVVAVVRAELAERVEAVLSAGMAESQIVIDPGIGFAKTGAQNWQLLRSLPELAVGGRPILVGASRKTFLGRLLSDPTGEPRPVDRRDDATQAITALAAAAGAWCVRVHDVGPALDAVRVAAAWTGRLVGESWAAQVAESTRI